MLVQPEQMLTDDVVHVAYASLDGLGWHVPSLASKLLPDEQQRAARFVFDRDRHRFIARRWLLRCLIGHYASVHPSRIRFRYNEFGKPFFCEESSNSGISFSASSSGDMAVVAVTKSRSIGVDVESYGRAIASSEIVERFFSIRERQSFSLLPRAKQDEAFLSLWTSKEAVVKAIGCGLQMPLDEIEVQLTDARPVDLRVAAQAIGQNWSVFPLALDSKDYVATLVVDGESPAVCTCPAEAILRCE